MKIGLLTSSRADFGIYLPLAKLLEEDPFFELEIIAFGTHLSEDHGSTISEIEAHGFSVPHKIKTTPSNDSPADIAYSIGETIKLFSSFWETSSFDVVLALGDRYEMFAAVAAASTFNLNIAHIHAGETTLGAIDNSYRHSISFLSKHLFVVHPQYKKRASEIIGDEQNIHNVGALSIDNLSKVDFLEIEDFKKKFNIDLSIPSILSTFHPETVSFEKNEVYINEIMDSFIELSKKYQIIITMPNSDTMGNLVRSVIKKKAAHHSNIILIESFGMIGYLSCMKHCSMMIGNTSSGFIEASYFPKYVINLGDRQKGRIITKNIIDTLISKKRILETVEQVEQAKPLVNEHIYGTGNAAQKIVEILKKV